MSIVNVHAKAVANSFGTPRRCRHNPYSFVAFAILGAILGLVGYLFWSSYESHHRGALVTTRNLVIILVDDIEGAFERAQRDLQVLAMQVTAEDLSGPGPEARRADVEARMAARLRAFPAVLNYHIFDAQGLAVFGAGSANLNPVYNVSDRDWFLQLRDAPQRDLVVSEVLISKSAQTQAIILGVAIRDGDGRFVGAVNAVVNLAYFQNLLDGLDIGPKGLVTVRRSDDYRLILRRPRIDAEINNTLTETSLAKKVLSGQPTGDGDFVSQLDNVKRTYSYRTLKNYPLTVIVAVAVDDYLEPWRKQTSVVGISALVLSLALILLYRREQIARNLAGKIAADLQLSERRLADEAVRLNQILFSASEGIYLSITQERLGPQLDDEIKKYIGFAVGGAKRMDRLIVDLLEYSRTGRSAGSEPVALAEVVAGSLANLTVAVRDADADVVVAKDLPTVNGNVMDLTRLFQNLIGNAVKYRAPDRRPRIDIGCRRSDNEWLVTVSDNGIGIAPKDRDRAFGIFQRLVPKDSYEGNGIGLAVCKKIVEQHGGRIWIESNEVEQQFSF